jgi:predicted metal-dependent phosphoesterase TrpH
VEYNINLHAHTIFSDGHNTPLAMAMEARELGFSALVLTDHFYGESGLWCSLNSEKMALLRRSKPEVKELIPVIIGIELGFGGEEILTFGSAMINTIIQYREKGHELTLDLLLEWKKILDSAFILCHPGNIKNWSALRPLLDGYEAYNSGQDYFRDGRDLGALEGLPGWCNSDAHSVEGLCRGWNIVDTKIETESDLIRYIKRGRQPKFYLGDKEE